MPPQVNDPIKMSKGFAHLRRAPIVEAVIQWQARSTIEWVPDDFRATLIELLPDYPEADFQHQVELAFEAALGEADAQPLASRQRLWHGVRLRSQDGKHVAQFTRDGLTFSCLPPYTDWEHFSAEGIRLWKLFLKLAAPSQIQRLGVRYLNRISGATVDRLVDYLKEPPSLIESFHLHGFLYQSQFDVPGHSLRISVIKATQPESSPHSAEAGLIIDIDVFTTKPMLCEDRVLEYHLPIMRQLKNQVFFDLMTQQAIEAFKQGE